MAYEICVYVDFTHIVYNHRDPLALSIIENVIEKRCLPRPEEA
jgi:hypothetical protein